MLKHFAIFAFVLCIAVPAFSEEAKADAQDRPAAAAGKETAKESEGDGAKTFSRAFKGFEVIALLDTLNSGDANLLIGASAEELENAAKPGVMDNSINAFVVKMNGKTILFDAGMPEGGIVAALKEAGISPEEIDAVVITHFHFDHVGGLLGSDNKPIFPKAELFVAKQEVDKWSDRGTMFLSVYGARSNVFDAGREIMPGVTAIAAYGHTPGHMVFGLEKDGDKLLIIGDLIHFPGVQLANPGIAVTYDVDPVKAVESRKRIFSQAAEDKTPIASMHIRFPGMGVLTRDGDGYAFEKIQ